jgi:phosphomevalonate kinase
MVNETQQTLNAIATLSGAIGPLIGAGQTDAIKIVVKKLLELVNKL